MTTKNASSLYASRRSSGDNISFHPVAWMEAFSLSLSHLQVFVRLANLYSTLFEVRVTALQAVYYFYAQLACLLFLLPVAYGGGWRMCFFLLFALSAKAAMGHDFEEDR